MCYLLVTDVEINQLTIRISLKLFVKPISKMFWSIKSIHDNLFFLESIGSEDEKTPKADKSSYTASSNSPDNDQTNGKTPTQSYEETGEFTAGTATHSQGRPSQAESGGQTPTQGRIEELATDPEITKASHMDIGGNKTGSITKSEDFTNSVVPSFRTRKRFVQD